MSTNKFQYWPSNGQLGSTKFTMPTNPEDWPSGDALVGNFVYNEGKIVDFIDIKGLTPNTSKSTTIPYDYVNIELPFAEDSMTINPGPRNKYLIIKFNDKEVEEGGSVIVTLKYKGCETVDDIKAVDPDYLTNDIVDGVWSEGLGDLKYGRDISQSSPYSAMFLYTQNLTSFNSNLNSLIDGQFMFYGCYGLTEFNVDMKSLVNGREMFYECPYLEIFESDMPSLTNGQSMFTSRNLRTFTSNLKSLTNGYGMFGESSSNNGISKLDTNSVKNIADTINDVRDLANSGDSPWNSDVYKTIHIGIGNTTPNTEETTAFNTIAARGWTVYVLGSGGNESILTPTSLTPIDGEEQQTPIPFWAKPIPSDEEHAHYVDENGNFYNILGAQFIYGDNLETYGMFTSIEDAAANMRLTKIEKTEIEKA